MISRHSTNADHMLRINGPFFKNLVNLFLCELSAIPQLAVGGMLTGRVQLVIFVHTEKHSHGLVAGVVFFFSARFVRTLKFLVAHNLQTLSSEFILDLLHHRYFCVANGFVRTKAFNNISVFFHLVVMSDGTVVCVRLTRRLCFSHRFIVLRRVDFSGRTRQCDRLNF